MQPTILQYIDVTNVTKIVALEESEYHNLPSYDPYTIYLVNSGDSEYPYTDMYYGERKYTDISVVGSRPDSSMYPDGRIYFVPEYLSDQELSGVEDSPQVIGYKMYFKFNGLPILLSTGSKISSTLLWQDLNGNLIESI